MKQISAIFAAFIAVLLLTGCGWIEGSRNLENARSLRVGMTKKQVLAIMGEPIRNEIFAKPDVWYYFIQTVWMDGLTTEDECMPLVFRNGILVGWGNEYYARTRLVTEPPKSNEEALRELDLGK